MNKVFSKVFDIRESEGWRALLMFSYIFLLIASLMIIKPVRNSLFLVKFGVSKLPYVYILVALCSFLIALLYSRVSRQIRLNYLIFNTLILAIVCLGIFWLLLHFRAQGSWVIYAFYIWVAIFAVITSAQFWLLANYIFDAREARRLFGFIGTGAILGGVFGGYLTNYLAPRLKTENLIFFCMGFLVICLFLLGLLWQKSALYRQRQRDHGQKGVIQSRSSENPMKMILNSRHLLYLSGIIIVSIVTANLVDFQFSAVASRIITETDRLTAFFGFWSSTFSIISLFIQLFFSGRVMKHMGVVASLFFLPLGLLLGAAAILISPVLWTAVLIKVSDGSLKHSINKAGMELLALPIPESIKIKTKTFIDIFIKNFAKGFGGALLILLTVGLNLTVQYISLVAIGLIGVWIWLIVKVKKEYIDSFRTAIQKHTINMDQQSLNLQDASVLNSFLTVLDGQNERQIIYVLKLLEDVENEVLIPRLKKLIKHTSGEVRFLVLRMALRYEDLDLSSEALALINDHDADQTVRTEAMHYVCKRTKDKDDRAVKLNQYFEHVEFHIRSAAIVCTAREWKENKDFRKEVDMPGLLAKVFENLNKDRKDGEPIQNRFIKLNTAVAIGESNNPELYPYLHILLEDDSMEVKKAAIISAGITRAPEFISVLLANLNTKHVRKFVREALAGFGEEIIERLSPYLEDAAADKGQRLAVPKVLALIGSQKSVDLCLHHLDQKSLLLRYEVIKASNKLRAKFTGLKFDERLIESRVLNETRQYYQILTILTRQKRLMKDSAAGSLTNNGIEGAEKARILLIKAVVERLDKNLERIFRLLGLKYAAKDMFNAYFGVRSNQSHLRANAVEFLDNILDSNLKKFIIPMVETSSPDTLAALSWEFFGFGVPSQRECFNFILDGDDSWLKVCALYLIGETKDSETIESVREMESDPDPLVKETAIFCLNKLV